MGGKYPVKRKPLECKIRCMVPACRAIFFHHWKKIASYCSFSYFLNKKKYCLFLFCRKVHCSFCICINRRPQKSEVIKVSGFLRWRAMPLLLPSSMTYHWGRALVINSGGCGPRFSQRRGSGAIQQQRRSQKHCFNILGASIVIGQTVIIRTLRIVFDSCPLQSMSACSLEPMEITKCWVSSLRPRLHEDT